MTVVRTVALRESFYDLYEMIPGFIAGFACCIGVSRMPSLMMRAVAELESVQEAVGPVF